MAKFVELLDIDPIQPSDWPQFRCVLDNSNLSEAAGELADAIATRRIGHNQRLYDVWQSHRLHGSAGAIGETDSRLLEAGLLKNLGTPNKPAADQHLHGLIAEAIWHEVVKHVDFGLGLPVHAEGNGWSVTDPGGDGLTIYTTDEGSYCFRLWESKYHGSDTPVRSTVDRACNQIESNALDYLSRFSSTSQYACTDPELASFYALLPEYWADNEPISGVGISVGTSDNADTERCFGMVIEFFGLQPSQHQALLHLVGDFVMLAEAVRNDIWKGCGLWTEP